MAEKHSPPTNLPNGWEYQAETHSVVCGGCLFRFGAEHPDSDGKWTCPNCGPVNGLPEAIAALEITKTMIADQPMGHAIVDVATMQTLNSVIAAALTKLKG